VPLLSNLLSESEKGLGRYDVNNCGLVLLFFGAPFLSVVGGLSPGLKKSVKSSPPITFRPRGDLQQKKSWSCSFIKQSHKPIMRSTPGNYLRLHHLSEFGATRDPTEMKQILLRLFTGILHNISYWYSVCRPMQSYNTWGYIMMQYHQTQTNICFLSCWLSLKLKQSKAQALTSTRSQGEEENFIPRRHNTTHFFGNFFTVEAV
jgi:hypothetical protein